MIALIIILLVLILFAVIYFLLIMPRVGDRADMDLLSVDFAHRGLWNEIYPENSLAAFMMAVNHGFGIELDIQLSKDKKIMVFHDYDLKRMCGVDKKLSELTFDELREFRLLGTEYVIPTLAEVLRAVDGKVPLLIELKGEDGNTELCKRSAAMLDKYSGAFCVESFNPLLLSWFKSFRPRYARGQLVTADAKPKKRGGAIIGFALSHLLLNVLSRPDFIAVNGKMRNRPVIYFCKRLFKVKIFVWTVKNKKDYEMCRREGSFSIFERFLP